jgi:ComF family protein
MLTDAMAGLDGCIGTSVLVVPVPLHQRKLHQRGFNQSEIIAKSALKLRHDKERFEFCANRLERRRETKSQIGLSSHQRRENLRGAFAVVEAERIKGREILLVDDVFTTGTTASECARVLRRAGASKVWVATVARTLKWEAAGLALPSSSKEEDDARLAMAAHG